MHFDTWRSVLSYPDWYVRLYPELKEILAELALLPEAERFRRKHEIYEFFETEITAERVALAATGKDFDTERQAIDTIVIHDTENPPGMTFERVNVIQLLKVYIPYYMNPAESDVEIKLKPLYSGHVRNGQQFFGAYTWMVRGDGTSERMLEDHEVGWHAGNWAVNCRSVGICLDNDYTNARPSDVELEAVARLIKEHYPQVPKQNLLGHREVNLKKNCPSNLFLSTPEVRGWKEDLLALL